MEMFLVTGLSSSSPKKLQLILPAGKHYKIHGVKNGEADLKTEALLDKAANRRKSLAFHITPVVWIDGHGQDDMPRTLQHILSRYPHPVGQGPVVPARLLHCRKTEVRAASSTNQVRVRCLDCQDTLLSRYLLNLLRVAIRS